jgi:erfK/ybiS/ycfS/ynhG family protein
MAENKKEPRKRGKKEKKGNKFALGVAVLGIVFVAGCYTVKANTYRTKFFPHTIINGIDASEKTVDEVRQVMSKQIDNFESKIRSRDNNDEIIKGSDVGLAFVEDSSLEDLLHQQNSMAWIANMSGEKDLKIKSSFTVDDNKFEDTVSKLRAFDESKFVAPVDAKISDFVQGSGYSIIPEVEGNTLDVKKAKEYIKSQLIVLNDDINLDYEENDLYEKPAKRSDDPTLNLALTNLNKYISARISYDKLNVLNGDTIHKWLTVNSDGSVNISDEGVASFVKTISNAYNTVGKAKTLKTSYGPTVTISGGSYGWKVDAEKEKATIKSLIEAGETTKREPEFSRKAASHGENDYGNSYVEVNLTTQHMFVIKNGSKVLDSDFVSGNVAKNWTTPPGAFPLTYKTRNATLKGEGYSTPVDYWMPFNGGIGFHDAPWRSAFGGQIYRTSGSHGCVNLPPAIARQLYDYVDSGFPVLCYNLTPTVATPETTESSSESSATEATVEPIGDTTQAGEIKSAVEIGQ